MGVSSTTDGSRDDGLDAHDKSQHAGHLIEGESERRLETFRAESQAVEAQMGGVADRRIVEEQKVLAQGKDQQRHSAVEQSQKECSVPASVGGPCPSNSTQEHSQLAESIQMGKVEQGTPTRSRRDSSGLEQRQMKQDEWIDEIFAMFTKLREGGVGRAQRQVGATEHTRECEKAEAKKRA